MDSRATLEERRVALSSRDAPRNTSGYVYHGLNGVDQDNGRLCRTMYLHRNVRIEHSDLARFCFLAVRFEDKKERRGKY